MVRIRLQRTGRKKVHMYKVVVADNATKNTGSAIEILGFFDPRAKLFNVKDERLKYWRSKGAKLSGRVASLLKEKKEA